MNRDYELEFASVSEGFCPDHAVPLTIEPKGGWCPACAAWWWIDYTPDPAVGSPHIVKTWVRL